MNKTLQIKFKPSFNELIGYFFIVCFFGYFVLISIINKFHINLDNVSDRNRFIVELLNNVPILYYALILFFIFIVVTIGSELLINIIMISKGNDFIYIKDDELYILKPHYVRIYFKEELYNHTKIEDINNITITSYDESKSSIDSGLYIGGVRYRNCGNMTFHEYRDALQPYLKNTAIQHKKLEKK